MNRKHLLTLFALMLVGGAAVAWAMETAPRAQASPAQEIKVTATVDDDAAFMADDDADELDLAADEDSPGGGDDRRVIVRRWVGGRGAMGMGASGHAGMMGMMAAHLDLTDAQREKFADIHERQLRHDIQARADLAIARLDLRKSMRAEKPDAGSINTQIDRLARMRAELAKSHVASMLEARSLLTPEQQKKMRAMHERGGPLMGGMGPGGMGRPGLGHGMGMGPGGRGMRGMGPGNPEVRVRVIRDTLRGESD